MQTFFCKLHPPRPTFPSDITPEESQVMAEHAAYWREWMSKGNIVAFGPVMDGSGAYGIGIVQFDDEAGVRSFADNDPTIKARVGFRMEVQPMPRGVITPFSGP
jgi:uncharacterized protein YciI